MECYYHDGVQACGICKSCNRGICKNCAAEVNNGIACKGKCEDKVVELDNLISSSTEMQKPNMILMKSVSVGAGDIFNLVLASYGDSLLNILNIHRTIR